MTPRRILVLGGGFAGLWASLSAARRLDELGVGPDAVEVVLVNRDAFHGIRVRFYEPDLAPTRVPLAAVLGPAGVRPDEGEVTGIDVASRTVAVGRGTLGYDRLVFALGSRLARPNLPGLAEHAFDVDTYAGASRFAAHLRNLPDAPGRATAVVVGAGLTGIETACELPDRLRAATGGPARIVLADHKPYIGSDMGEDARPVIAAALSSLGVETRPGVSVASIDANGVTFADGGRLEASTVVWCAGMRADPLAATVCAPADAFGRVPVDAYLRVEGVPGVFAAGDSARAMVDDAHASVMSCQHGRPMGRVAGHNAVGDLLGLEMLPLRIDWYTTILDLGPAGALYTEGWDRRVVATGEEAKRTKRVINGSRIYPPLTGDRAEIFAAAAPVIQRPPARG